MNSTKLFTEPSTCSQLAACTGCPCSMLAGHDNNNNNNINLLSGHVAANARAILARASWNRAVLFHVVAYAFHFTTGFIPLTTSPYLDTCLMPWLPAKQVSQGFKICVYSFQGNFELLCGLVLDCYVLNQGWVPLRRVVCLTLCSAIQRYHRLYWLGSGVAQLQCVGTHTTLPSKLLCTC